MVTFYTFPPQEAHFMRFWATYELSSVVGCTGERVAQQLKPAKERRCRFCQRDAAQTTFRKEAHLLSRMLGNRYILSDSECDACNELFGGYENDLANFLGVTRSLFGVQGVKKAPTFKSNDRLITVRKSTLFGGVEGVSLERDDIRNEAICFHPEQGRADITLQRQPYVPARVYKALLKMALSVLPEIALEEYERARQIVLGTAPAGEKRVDRVLVYELPMPYRQPYPFCFLFTRKDGGGAHLKHLFYLQFQNQVFTFPIPGNQQDIAAGLYQSGEFTTMICPPILFREPDPGAVLTGVERLDLSSQQTERKEQVLSFYYAKEALENVAVLDLETGALVDEAVHFDEIKGIFLTPAGSLGQVQPRGDKRSQPPEN